MVEGLDIYSRERRVGRKRNRQEAEKGQERRKYPQT